MRIAAWVTLTLGAITLAFLAVCGIVNAISGDRPMPKTYPLIDEQETYRVAILGDSQKGLANLRNLIEAVKKEKVDLILHTGDLVSDNDEGHYRLAALYLGRSLPDRVPWVVAPGNHDIKGSTSRFRREIGDLERTFRKGGVLFVVLNNALGDPPDLKRLPAAKPGEAIVLVMHVPPFDVRGNVLPGWEPFVAWLEKSRVRYLFCGHIHDYVRRTIGQTIVIANGVGGDYESWQLKQKVYATILQVDGDSLTDRVIELPPEHGIMENLEHLAIGHVAEAFRTRRFGCALGAIALVGLMVAAIRVLRRTNENPVRALPEAPKPGPV